MMDTTIDEQEYDKSATQAEVINSLIRQYAKLDTMLKDVNKKQKYWTTKQNKLHTAVAFKRIKLCEVGKLQQLRRSTVSEGIITNDSMQNAWETVKKKRVENRIEKCQQFCVTDMDSANSFLNAQTEYSTKNLMNSIEYYRQESKKVSEELKETRKRLNDLEKKYFTEYIDGNKDAEESNLDIVLTCLKSANNFQVSRISSADQTVYNTLKKIQKTKEAVNRCKEEMSDSVFRKPRVPL